jgi:pilus assembly protein CpaE
MNRPAQALVVMDDRVDRSVVETLVTSSAHLDVNEYMDVNGFLPSDERGSDVVIVACAEFTPKIAEYVSAAARQHPGVPVLVACSSGSNGYVSEAMHAGAEDVIAIPANGDLAAARKMADEVIVAVEKALARRRGVPAAMRQRTGTMICILGLKGGSGKTLTAANLAVALAQAGGSVALVDLDLQFGDVGLALGMKPERTLYDLVRSGGSMDADKLRDFMTVHASGVRALLAPARPDQAGVVTAAFLRDLYPLVRDMHDFVIVDTPPSFTPEVIGAVDASNDVCVVTMLDSLALKNSKLGLETLELMDYRGQVRLVLNRADSNVGISPADVVAILGRRPDVLVPSDRDITRAVNRGQPIVAIQRKSDAARSFHTLASLYLADRQGDEASAGARARRRGLFRRR